MSRTIINLSLLLLAVGCIGQPGIWVPDAGSKDVSAETAGGDSVPDLSLADVTDLGAGELEVAIEPDVGDVKTDHEVEVFADINDVGLDDQAEIVDVADAQSPDVTDLLQEETSSDTVEVLEPDVCTPDCEGKVCGDDGCGGDCGQCPVNHLCLEFVCECVPACEDAECGPDGCEGICGECSETEECVEGQCQCAPDCDGKDCGDDGCGGTCGDCDGQDECIDDLCVCQPWCDGVDCGTDGCDGVCGECTPPDACEDGVCVCQPECTDINCGFDGCGGECGECGAQEECVEGLCTCIPECDGKLCGADGCGGFCGVCGEWEECHPTWFVCVAQSIAIAEGPFWMGCNDGQDALAPDACSEPGEKPLHEVHLSSYTIDATEVTAGQYAACVGKNMCYAVTDVDCWQSETNHGKDGFEEHPMNCVTWQQARSYCKWIGKDLCTEAQWEKAARGGCEKYPDGLCKNGTRNFPWGGFYNGGCDYTVHAGCQCDGGTCAVGQHTAGESLYGVQNLGGNVTEWVRDWFADDYYCHGPEATPGVTCGDDPVYLELWTDPVGPDAGEKRSFRGAGFVNALEYQFRLAFRNRIIEISAVDNMGFRCCAYECLPNCDGRQCGEDGCGGVCGECAGQDACVVDQCICQPACDGKGCGDDGCGGVCGTCTSDDPCLDPVCDAETGLCGTEPAAGGTPCEDGMYCTDNDACDDMGTCIGGLTTDCSELDSQCGTGGCDEDNDSCIVAQFEVNTTPCNADDDGCTLNDECLGGQCVAGAAIVCQQPPQPCEESVCQADGPDKYNCIQGNKPEGSLCIDDLFCTTDEQCDGDGSCQLSPYYCGLVPSECIDVECDELADDCDTAPVANGTACSDGDSCTLTDSCQNGVCEGAENVCQSRVMSTDTGIEGEGSLAVGAQGAHLGFGEIISVWRAGDWSVRGRFLDGDLSMSYPETDLTAGWAMADDACVEGRAMTTPSVAAGAGGDFILAVPQRHARLWVDPQNDTWCRRRLDWQLSFAGYDPDGEVKKSATMLGPPENLWYGDKKKLGTTNAGECACTHYPDDYAGWMGAGFPDHEDLPFDSVHAFSFPNGSYGVLRHVMAKPTSEAPLTPAAYYHSISDNFEANTEGVSLGEIYDPRGCASETVDRLLVVYHDGAGSLSGLFVDQPGNVVSQSFGLTALASGHLTGPWCSALPDGRFTVVFSDCALDGPCDIYAEVLESDGTLAGVSANPAPQGGGGQSPTAPPAVTTGGSSLIAWHDDSGDADGFGAFGRFYSAGLVALTEPVRFNDAQGGDQLWPWVLALGNDFMALWADVQGDGTLASFRMFDTDGMPVFGVPQRTVVEGANSQSTKTRIAADDSVRVTLVWEAYNLPGGSGKDIALQNFTTEGYAAGDLMLANQSVPKNQINPDVARSSIDGRVSVVFEQPNASNEPRIHLRQFSHAGSSMTGEIQIDPLADGDQTQPAIAAFDDGGFAVAYTTNHVPQYDEVMYLQMVDNNGQPTLGPYSMSQTKTDVRSQEPDMVSGGGSPQVVYLTWANYSMDWTTSQGVYVRAFEQDGSGGTAEVTVTTSGAPRNPTVAYDAASGVVVCWATGVAIKCARYDKDLTPLGSHFILYSGGSPAHPHISFADSSSLWGVFENADPGDGDGRAIVRFAFNLQGQATERPIIVNLATAGDQGRPTMATLPTSKKFIAWESADPGVADGIFYRLLD